MIRQTLHENWVMHSTNDPDPIPAVVPGSVYNDYLLNGKMEDPYFRDNEMKALQLMEQDFVYETVFTPDPELFRSERIVLEFLGIDTVADVFLNGVLLGHVENMHRTWRFEVKELLLEGENTLRVVLYSPTKFIREAYEKTPEEGSAECSRGFPLLRKAHCMFGWDWGPRFPDAGIWRDVSLQGSDPVVIDSIYIRQKHENGQVWLLLEPTLDDKGTVRPFSDADPELSYTVIVTDPDGKKVEVPESPSEILIRDPKLWWPNGFGEQPLYEVEMILLRNGVETDRTKKRIGLRTLTVRIQKDEWGESFAHEINGVRVFAMGEDYIPEDNILSRVTRERTFNLLRQCRDANFNTIRVWGGGHYPADDFYDACDEYGLLVWEDLMFACALYRFTPEFEENITAEVIDNVKRLRHHASLALWCGNNEMEMFTADGMWVTRPGDTADYIKMYEYLFPKLLRKYDPETFYWPASPSSGGSFDAPNDYNRGDVHYWSVWHANVPFTDYRKYYFRYLSEFGFQSFPAEKTIETFTEPGDRNIFSYVMEKHQRNNAANGKIMNYLSQTFLYPTEFGTLLYASQLLQAEAMKYGVEHFRRNRGRCMGAVIWQLNDCWPVASWSSIDYTGRWKATHYYAKRFFAPVLLSCEEEGLLTQDPNVNAEPYEVRKTTRFNISNETMQDLHAEVFWSLRDAGGTLKRSGSMRLSVPALSAAFTDTVDFGDAALYDDYVSYYAVSEDGTPFGFGTVIFSIPKHFRYRDPKLSLHADGDEIIVRSGAYAKSVEIQNADETLLLSDNYFDMDPGEKRVKILSGSTEGLTVRSVYDIR